MLVEFIRRGISVLPMTPVGNPARKVIIGLAILCMTAGMILRIMLAQLVTDQSMVHQAFVDDAYYYLEIARNVADSGEFTFDGINHTNGFHPLWQVILAGLALLTKDQFLFMRIVYYFSIVMFLVSGVLLFRLVSIYGGIIAGLAGVVIWSLSPEIHWWQALGMENTITFPLLIMSLFAIKKFLSSPVDQLSSITLGSVFGLLVWSRSDTLVFVCLALGIMSIRLWQTREKEKSSQLWLNLGLVAGLVVLTVLIYLEFNFWVAGSTQSVSAAAKLRSGFATLWNQSSILEALNLHISMLWKYIGGVGGLSWEIGWKTLPFRVFILTWFPLALGWWFWKIIFHNAIRTMKRFLTCNLELSILLLYTLFHTILLVTLLRYELAWTPWYLVPQLLTILIVIPLALFPKPMLRDFREFLDKFMFRTRDVSFYNSENDRWVARLSVSIGVVALLMVFASLFWVMTVPPRTIQKAIQSSKTMVPGFELATWLNEHVPPVSRVGMYDAGITGYFSEAKVINLDGLVNSPEYLDVLHDNKVSDYIIQNQIEYIIQYYFVPGANFPWNTPEDDSRVCHKLLHVNTNPAKWQGSDGSPVDNYFEVVGLRYDGNCGQGWVRGFPRTAVPPE